MDIELKTLIGLTIFFIIEIFLVLLILFFSFLINPLEQQTLENTTIEYNNTNEILLNTTILNKTHSEFVTINISIDKKLSEYYRTKKIIASDDDNIFYNQFFNQEPGQEVFKNIYEYHYNNTYNEEETFRSIQYYIGGIPYRYSRTFYFPITIVDQNYGACFDKSILFIEIFKHAEYGLALLDFPSDNHMAVGILCTEPLFDEYCFLETTTKHSRINNLNVTYSGGNILNYDDYKIIEIYEGKTLNITGWNG